MAYKDILVCVGAQRATATLDAAIGISAGAHVVALHVKPPPFVYADLGPGALSDMIRWQMDREREAAEHAEREVAAARQRTGAAIEFRIAEGEIIPTVASHAAYADLVIVGRGAGAEGSGAYVAGAVALGAGRPVLIVPDADAARPIGQRVLIAWNGSREASRALHDALPALARAKAVTVFEINSAIVATPRLVGAEIARHLARHGIAVTVETAAADDAETGPLLLRRADEVGADLLVAGAYGHSRLRELVFGGVTRHLLDSAPIPVLLSH